MKNLLYAGIVFGLCFSACKKDKEEDSPGPTTPTSYSLVAPTCLISSAKIDVDGDISNSNYQYDGLRRLISITNLGSDEKTIYQYIGNTIIVSETADDGNGNMETTVTTNYLNAMGFISMSVEDDSTKTFYTYDGQGYLIKTVTQRPFGGFQQGSSYQYSKGNKITGYDLNLDWETGATIDSTLRESYFYYDNLPGKMEEEEAWVERKGRGSKKALKSISGGFSTSAYEYLIGPNGLPTTINFVYVFGSGKMDLVWKCN